MSQDSITWDEWEATYKPTTDFEIELEDIPEGTSPHNVWTMIDGEGRYLDMMNGYHYFNRLGYFVTEVPWNEDEEIYITNQKEF